MIFPRDVPGEFVGIKVDIAQLASRVAKGLVVEMRRRRIAAFAARGDGHGADPGTELNDGDKTVAVRAVEPLAAVVSFRAEGGERSPL